MLIVVVGWYSWLSSYWRVWLQVDENWSSPIMTERIFSTQLDVDEIHNNIEQENNYQIITIQRYSKMWNTEHNNCQP